ncbi:MAG: TraM recognition domain-containing protein [Fibrobacteria bacterium]
MIVMELQLLAGARQAGKDSSHIGVQCYLDEFGSFAYNGFIDMLDKCRSSRIGFVLAHQSMGNLKRENLSGSFKDELVDNTYQKFFLNINDETAAWASRQLGARKVIKKSLAIGQMTDKTHIHGRDNQTVTFREELEPYVLPSEFSLSKGYGFGIIENGAEQSIKAVLRFGYVHPDELCSDQELKDFLERALLDHPKCNDGRDLTAGALPEGPKKKPIGPKDEPTEDPPKAKKKGPNRKGDDGIDQIINEK